MKARLHKVDRFENWFRYEVVLSFDTWKVVVWYNLTEMDNISKSIFFFFFFFFLLNSRFCFVNCERCVGRTGVIIGVLSVKLLPAYRVRSWRSGMLMCESRNFGFWYLWDQKWSYIEVKMGETMWIRSNGIIPHVLDQL